MQAEMILILTETNDNTADKVCQWLYYYREAFIRINSDVDAVWVDSIEFRQEEVTIKIGHNSGIYNLSDFGLVWFRRGKLINVVKPVKNNIFPDDQIINEQIYQHLDQELDALNDFVYKHVHQLTVQINNPLKYNINKLECLYEAAKIGLTIPDTLVTSHRRTMTEFRKRHPIVTKNISDILICHSQRFFMSQSTMPVRDKDILRANTTFFPSLFQQAIDKKADIRVFFLLGKIFATALYTFSQPDLTDFRGANQMVVVPFELPHNTGFKLLALADKMGLESGSADFVLDKNEHLTFLEINPVGQIDFVSFLTHKYFEKDIAKILIQYATNHKEIIDQ